MHLIRNLSQFSALMGILLLPPTAFAADAEGIAFFEKKIRPVLDQHCLSCHSQAANKQKGGLYLDSREAILTGGDSGPSAVVGKPDESLIVQAIRYTIDEIQMPPKGKLPPEVVKDFEKWVSIGLPDPRKPGKAAGGSSGPISASKLWSFQPVKSVTPPKPQLANWGRSPIDAFILAQLEAKGLKPNRDADRAVLLRRVTFDLIGMAPTPEEIDAFEKDSRPDAFERVVDRLLASPHFGERWGRHWLDLARFAESSGGGRSLLLKDAWRYRDYVIDRFNRDIPYDQFLTEQIAGDLMPSATPEERRDRLIATGFLLLGPTNYERQDKTALEMDVIDEQIDTIGKAVMGMTIGCARCHDHKFDPIPTRDYYALAGIMRSTHTLIHENVSKWVERPLPVSAELQAKIDAHQGKIRAVQDQLKAARALAGKGNSKAAERKPMAIASLPGIVVDDAQAKKIGSWKPSTFSNHFVGAGYLYDDRGSPGVKTVTFVPNIPKTGNYEVRLAFVPSTNRAKKVPVRVFHADGDVTIPVDMRQTPPIEERFVSLGTFRFEAGDQWFVMLSSQDTDGHVIADAVLFIPESEQAKPTASATDKPGAGPNASVATAQASIPKLEAELKKLQADAPTVPTAMAVQELPKMQDCYICIRGNHHNRGPIVPRGFLSTISLQKQPKIPSDQSGRLALAEWLTRPEHPLTGRVMVNRIWQHLFGVGIVRTVDLFGTTGELPSHPELLDYLAKRFVDHNWSTKQMIREIVLSRTYQLDSTWTDAQKPQALAVDPENRLFGRANRRRLEAEPIRDAMLQVAGEIELTIGGPLMKKGVSERDTQFDSKRRSVYLPVLRNRMPDLYEVFDFADPNSSLGRRNVSTVATQALYFMNHPEVHQFSVAASKRLLAFSELSDLQRIDLAYRWCYSRLPRSGERELIAAFVGSANSQSEREHAWAQVFQSLFSSIDFRYIR